MKKHLLSAAAAIAVVSSPAFARDNSPYVGVEAGVLFPESQDGDFNATFTQSAQSPAAGSVAPLPGTGFVGALPAPLATAPAPIVGPGRVKWKTGFDVDVIAGYDLGMFKIEGELGYKRAKMKDFAADTSFGTSVAAALNPAGTTGTAFIFPGADNIDFGINDHVTVWSAMVNGLLDIGGNDGIGGYVGGGFGRAWVKELGESDDAWAYQGIAGITFPISSSIDIGLKYRYFRTGHLNFDTAGATLLGSTRTVAVPNTGVGATGSTNVTFTRTALVNGAFDDHFSSHSLLLSLIYSFGAPPPPPVVVPAAAPAPVAPPPPATQTCPDGTVILASDMCPAPPPPPPPPPPAPERG